MKTYIGYGFDVNDITDKELANAAEKYNEADFVEYLKDYGIEKREDFIPEWIDCHYNGAAGILCDIINNEEKLKLVIQYDNYIVFDSIDFLDYCKERALKIKNRYDFIQLIAKYVPVKNIKFGNLYTNIDWIDDPCYYLE